MPGEMQLVEGKVEAVYIDTLQRVVFDVGDLQKSLEKWVGRKVSITIEDVTE